MRDENVLRFRTGILKLNQINTTDRFKKTSGWCNGMGKNEEKEEMGESVAERERSGLRVT